MIRRLLFAISLLGLCLLAAPPTASAYRIFNGVDCSKQTAEKSTVCNEKNDTNNPLTVDKNTGNDGLLIKITNIVAIIGGAAAVIVIVIGALRFVTAGSDTSKGGRVDSDVENARRSIAGALVGLAIIVLAKLLITFIVNKLQ